MPEIQVTDLPYTIRDDAVAAKLQESVFFDEMRKAVLEKTGNILLVAVGNTGSWRNFATTKKKVTKVSDLKGLKIRTIASDLQGQFVKELGASPTPIPWNELYTSLSTGIVDGTKNSIGDYIPMGMAEPLNHICLDGHTYIFGFTWMSQKWLKSLPADLQGLVLDAMRIGAQIQTNFNIQYQAIAAEKWLEMGNTITVPTATDMQDFLAVRKKMEAWYRSKFGDEWLDKWLSAIEAAEKQVDMERNKVLIK
jgi:TRAP-type C4-dicarboxylate transport system substrate-binding protein